VALPEHSARHRYLLSPQGGDRRSAAEILGEAAKGASAEGKNIFVVVGAYRNVPVATEDGHVEARRVSTLKYTYDERIEDGFYCARAIKRMKELLEEPERLI